jgi:hypothetical protein
MKMDRIIFVFLLAISFLSLQKEAEAVRPPLNPLNRDQFRKMIAGADVIATGTVSLVTQSKTQQTPLETVTIHVTLTAERILKGNRSMKTLAIEESYRQFSSEADAQHTSGGRQAADKAVTSRVAGPAPPVGRYREGDRVVVFLKTMEGLNQYRPLGSGDHDAYLGVFQITPEGVKSDRYLFDEIVAGHAGSEDAFLKYITSVQGE